MKKKLTITLFAILFAFPFCAQAMTFTSDGTIQGSDNWMNVSIIDTPPNYTVVTMTGGTVGDSMAVHNAATLNMSGGNVGNLGALEQSSINISGGSLAILSAYDNATVTISQNASIYTAGIGYSSVFNMNGGTIVYLAAGDNAILNLSGGIISDSLRAYHASIVNIFGNNLSKIDTGGIYGYGQVIGNWNNGSQFTINLFDTDTYSCINLIPEPATLLLFSIGTFLLRKSYK